MTPETTEFTDEAFRLATEQVLREHARMGGVILGRAGAVVLRDLAGALHASAHRPTGAPNPPGDATG
jgi:hypothetical protein